MAHDPNEQFDHTVLDLIEHSPVGAVPHTPAYQDAVKRLYASHQVYASADHKDGHVTVRSLAAAPQFHAANLDELVAGRISSDALESNAAIFDRYVRSLPATRQSRAEGFRVAVIGKAIHHRARHGQVIRDPVHSIFLVPGAGPHPGLPGNYLHGSLFQASADAATWTVHVHDSDDGDAWCEAPDLAAALACLKDVLASAPFHLTELEALGFHLN